MSGEVAGAVLQRLNARSASDDSKIPLHVWGLAF